MGLQTQAPKALQAGGSGSAGQQVGRNPTPNGQGTSDDEGISMADEEQPAGRNSSTNRQYGNIENPSWSFDGIAAEFGQPANHGAEMLLDNVEDDADSNAAEQDSDQEHDFDDWNNREEEERITVGTSDDYEDDMYAHHVEDTSMTSFDDHDPPAVDITLSDDSHTKMD